MSAPVRAASRPAASENLTALADPLAGSHGTYSGSVLHQVLRIPRCTPCKRAAAAYMADYRKRGRCAAGLGWPLLPGPGAASRGKA